MALALLAVLVVLGLGMLAPELARLRQFVWLRSLLAAYQRQLGDSAFWRSGLGLALVLLPPVLLVALLDRLLNTHMHGLLDFGFSVVVLFLCWGPRDFDGDARTAAKAQTADDRSEALAALGGNPAGLSARSADLVDAVFSAALVRNFAPLFWFIVFGPAAALGYRMTQLLAQSADLRTQLPLAQAEAASRLHAALAWLPAQLMTLALALASDFDAVTRAWRGHHEAHGQGVLHLDLGFLGATARACVDLDDSEFAAADGTPISDPAVEESRRLIWRVMVVWLALMAVVVLAGWSG